MVHKPNIQQIQSSLFRRIKHNKINDNISSKCEDRGKRKAINEIQPEAEHEVLTDATDLVLSLLEAKVKMVMWPTHWERPALNPQRDRQVPPSAFSTGDRFYSGFGEWDLFSPSFPKC